MPDVVVTIRTVNVDEGSKKAIGSYTELSSAIGLVRQGLEVVQKAYDATIGKTLEYANQVRSLSMISGESAENTSRFIQVLDDYKIGADEALTATRALTKNGLSPNIDTLATLSDQYLKLNSVEERNAFVIKNLGRAGLQWTEVLNKGSVAIKAQGAAVAQGLILNEKQLAQSRKLEIAQDVLSESWEQVALSIGNKAIPAITEMTDEMNNTIRAVEIMKEAGMSSGEIFLHMANTTQEYVDALAQANTETLASRDAMLANAEATEQNELSLKEQEAAIAATSEANSQFLSVLGQVDSAMDAYYTGLAEAKAALDAGTISTDEHKAKVAELAAQYDEARAQIVLSIVEMKLAADGWTDAELNAYLEIGQAQGAFTQDTVNAAKAAVKSANDIIASSSAAGDQIFHTGERAEDAAINFGTLSESAYELSEAGYEAAGGVGAVKSQMRGMPPSGTSWSYDFIINVHGQVPKVATASYSTSAGYNTNVHAGGGGHAAGGMFQIPMSSGWENFALGGRDTATGGETLAIAPRGQDFIDYDKFASLIPTPPTAKEIGRAVVEAFAQAGM